MSRLATRILLSGLLLALLTASLPGAGKAAVPAAR